MDLQDHAVQALGQFKDFLLRWDFLQRDFALADWIDPQPLQSLQS